MREGHVDRLALFLAPKLLGAGLTWLDGKPTRSLAEAAALTAVNVEQVGEDLLITGRPLRPAPARPRPRRRFRL